MALALPRTQNASHCRSKLQMSDWDQRRLLEMLRTARQRAGKQESLTEQLRLTAESCAFSLVNLFSLPRKGRDTSGQPRHSAGCLRSASPLTQFSGRVYSAFLTPRPFAVVRSGRFLPGSPHSGILESLFIYIPSCHARIYLFMESLYYACFSSMFYCSCSAVVIVL